jgi:GH15 family glucan-1,4-alpha-glucosidase
MTDPGAIGVPDPGAVGTTDGALNGPGRTAEVAPQAAGTAACGPHDGPAALPIEDYALIGDCLTGALVGRNGSIDWLCWPRFDGGACFAALLGTSRHGRWLIAPAQGAARATRSYRGDTLVLETVFELPEGSAAVIDFMPTGREASSVVRIVEGRRGRVAFALELLLRFDYGSATPWVSKLADGSGVSAIVGPDTAVLRSPVPLSGRDQATVADFSVNAGERLCFTLTHGISHLAPPAPFDAVAALADTEAFWRGWSERCEYQGPWRNAVLRSLLTLKALTYAPTGGIVAAVTTSLPEQLGGTRNWDYRYCWLRDATLTLIALMEGGYYDEAVAWRQWLQRSVAGNPDELQIMYGIAGERRLVEWTPTWLPGYQGAAPVRIGNAASEQLQLDIYGELIGAMHHGRLKELAVPESAWAIQVAIIEHLAKIWNEPDAGIWEMRGDRRQFTHSKVMAWVALDRSIRDAEHFKLTAPLEHWRQVRDAIHAEVCAKGFDAARNTFTQSFGAAALDASLLLIPQFGFLPIEDPRITGTIQAIERELLVDGLVLRYRTEGGGDSLPPGEGAFLPCSFWLADAYALQGRHADAQRLFERLLGLANDVGLLAEEYDVQAQRLVGNFPQAFSHLALISAAMHLRDGVAGKRTSPLAASADSYASTGNQPLTP